MTLQSASDHSPARLTVLATSYQSGAIEGRNLGENGYSYDFVVKQFAPLLAEAAEFETVSNSAAAAQRLAELQSLGRQGLHLGFRALHELDLVVGGPNIAVPAWEFPDLPVQLCAGDPRHDWVRVANQCDYIIQLCEFTRESFARAGVTTPMAVIPVPVAPQYFNVEDWCSRESVTLETPALELVCESAHRPVPPDHPSPRGDSQGRRRSFQSLARQLGSQGYKKLVRPLLPWWLDRGLAAGFREARVRRAGLKQGQVQSASSVTLSGVVYTSVFNPYDRRKNWEDLLSAFLLTLGNRPDVTLVLKLARSDRFGAEEVLARYRALGIPHQCRVVLLTGFLTDEQMSGLARATTYYLTTTRAEGACLPLMQWLAAGRPAVSPRHTAIADYFSPDVGFVVESHPEPCVWPHDPEQRLRTTWHRLVWSSLADQMRQSYHVAVNDPARYRQLAGSARQMSLSRHHPDRVRGLLAAVVDRFRSSAAGEPATTAMARITNGPRGAASPASMQTGQRARSGNSTCAVKPDNRQEFPRRVA